jgi:hypothetical protein
LEFLGYCAIHWISGKLPWVDLIKNPVHVQESKKKSMANVKGFLKETLEAVGSPSEVVKFMEFFLNEVNRLEFETEPDYVKIHSKIADTLSALGHSKNDKDNFYVFSTESKVAKKSEAKAKESSLVVAAADIDRLEISKAKKRDVTSQKAAQKKVNKTQKDDDIEEIKFAEVPKDTGILNTCTKTRLNVWILFS